jgi:hypothetical protein
MTVVRPAALRLGDVVAVNEQRHLVTGAVEIPGIGAVAVSVAGMPWPFLLTADSHVTVSSHSLPA